MPEKTSYQPGEIDWIDLGTSDMDASIAFYGGLFGWTCERGGEDVGGYSTFHREGKAVGGVTPLMMEGQPVAWTSYVCTDDADKTAELVTTHGGTVLMPPQDVMDIGRMAVVADPTGAAISVWQPREFAGAQVMGEEGSYGWTELASRDQDAAIPFYENVFGWVAHRNPGYTEFHLGEGTEVAGCMDMPEMVPAEVPSYWMPYFNSDDPAAKAQQAAALGATLLVPFMEMENVAFSVVQDPQGAVFGLVKMTG
jgi:hypothetical protein